MFTRTRYQNGSLRVQTRGSGTKVWEFRYYEPSVDGGRASRSATVGTLAQYPNQSAARKSSGVQAILLRINAGHPIGPATSTCGALIGRYVEEEMPERYSTRSAYQSIIDR